jgi:hypothetical protein
MSNIAFYVVNKNLLIRLPFPIIMLNFKPFIDSHPDWVYMKFSIDVPKIMTLCMGINTCN